MPQSLIGLDVGGSAVKAVAMADRRVTGRAISDRYERPDDRTLRAAFAQVIDALGPIPSAPCVGLCMPGLLSADRSRVELAVNLPGLPALDLRREITRLLPEATDVRLFSDALASAYADWTRHPQPGRLLALVIGTGVGAAVLDDGAPLEIVDACPGHIGQLDVGHIGSGPAPIGPDHGRGSLEAYLGAQTLTRRFGRDRLRGLLDAPPDDPALVALARAIRISHAIYRPDEIALLGGIGTRLGPRLGDIDALVREDLTDIARRDWTLRCGDSDQAGAEGAALLAAR